MRGHITKFSRHGYLGPCIRVPLVYKTILTKFSREGVEVIGNTVNV
jgi:hypothetical protein